jgi:hypothetical protein
LRLEIAFKIDKKKNEKKEFYFSSLTKNFLTRKEKHECPRKNQKNFAADFLRDGSRGCREAIKSVHIAVNAIADLTELPHARNFPAFRVPLDGDQNAGDAHEDKQSGQLRF